MMWQSNAPPSHSIAGDSTAHQRLITHRHELALRHHHYHNPAFRSWSLVNSKLINQEKMTQRRQTE
jgi:hypothetical protein